MRIKNKKRRNSEVQVPSPTRTIGVIHASSLEYFLASETTGSRRFPHNWELFGRVLTIPERFSPQYFK
jgi:hypothetical protein